MSIVSRGGTNTRPAPTGGQSFGEGEIINTYAKLVNGQNSDSKTAGDPFLIGPGSRLKDKRRVWMLLATIRA